MSIFFSDIKGVIELLDVAHNLIATEFIWGVLGTLGILISVAMISRIAKAFQDYFSNVIVQKFGAKIFTDGLNHSMELPYQEFEDQRSGETLSILSKVRTDTERFIIAFINVLFSILVGIVFISEISPILMPTTSETRAPVLYSSSKSR